MKLDVVGVQEAAQMLGVEVPRISRWIKGGKMPPMVAGPRKYAGLLAEPPVFVEATAIWRRSDVEILAKRGVWKPEFTREKVAPGSVPIAGLKEVAALCGTSTQQIGRWRRAGQFPEPRLDKRPHDKPWKRGKGLGATPLWEIAQIEEWRGARAA